MRSFAVVAVLGFGLVVFASTFRKTRTHVYSGTLGEQEFAIEIPRRWVAERTEKTPFEGISGTLPSGARAYLLIQAGRDPDQLKPSVASGPPDLPDGAIYEQWEEAGWKYTYHFPKGRWSGLVWCRAVRGDHVFGALATGPDNLSREDFAVLDACVRSIRWIGP